MKLICPLPWSSATVLPNQRVAVCCVSMEDTKNRPDEPLPQTLNGERMRAIRRSFLDGKWPEECSGCRDAESRGQFSRRQEMLRRELYQDFFKKEHTEEMEEIIELDLSFGRLCNLKCRMCSPNYSSKWNEDAEAMYPTHSGIIPPEPMELDADPELLIPHLGHCREIVLKGGEPTLDARALRFLERVAQAGLAPQLVVTVVTNMTVLNPRFLEVLLKFGYPHLCVSVDGVDPWFRYIRHGRFTARDIKNNMVRAKSLGFHLDIATSFSIYNMLSYDRILDEFGEVSDHFTVSYVNNDALCPQLVAPAELRAEAIRRLHEIPQQSLSETSRRTIRNLVTYLEHGRFKKWNWELFVRFTAKLDELRGESIDAVERAVGELMRMNAGRAAELERIEALLPAPK